MSLTVGLDVESGAHGIVGPMRLASSLLVIGAAALGACARGTAPVPTAAPATCPPGGEAPVAEPERAPEPAPEPALVLQDAAFSELPGWSDDAVDEAIPALLASCEALARAPAE